MKTSQIQPHHLFQSISYHWVFFLVQIQSEHFHTNRLEQKFAKIVENPSKGQWIQIRGVSCTSIEDVKEGERPEGVAQPRGCEHPEEAMSGAEDSGFGRKTRNPADYPGNNEVASYFGGDVILFWEIAETVGEGTEHGSFDHEEVSVVVDDVELVVARHMPVQGLVIGDVTSTREVANEQSEQPNC
jgi:hypothetical protein